MNVVHRRPRIGVAEKLLHHLHIEPRRLEGSRRVRVADRMEAEAAEIDPRLCANFPEPGAHTPDEKLDLEAAEKVWIYLKEILKSFPNANG